MESKCSVLHSFIFLPQSKWQPNKDDVLRKWPSWIRNDSIEKWLTTSHPRAFAGVVDAGVLKIQACPNVLGQLSSSFVTLSGRKFVVNIRTGKWATLQRNWAVAGKSVPTRRSMSDTRRTISCDMNKWFFITLYALHTHICAYVFTKVIHATVFCVLGLAVFAIAPVHLRADLEQFGGWQFERSIPFQLDDLYRPSVRRQTSQ